MSESDASELDAPESDGELAPVPKPKKQPTPHKEVEVARESGKWTAITAAIGAITGIVAAIVAVRVTKGSDTDGDRARSKPTIDFIGLQDVNSCRPYMCTLCGQGGDCVDPKTCTAVKTEYTGFVCELPARVKVDTTIDENTQVQLIPYMLDLKPGIDTSFNYELFLNRSPSMRDSSGRPKITVRTWKGAQVLGGTIQVVTFP